MITISSERPNIVRGNSRLIQPSGCKARSLAGPFVGPAADAPRSSAGANPLRAAAIGSRSIRSERIAGAAHRLQIARESRVALDLAAQPRHLNIDVADVAAE